MVLEPLEHLLISGDLGVLNLLLLVLAHNSEPCAMSADAIKLFEAQEVELTMGNTGVDLHLVLQVRFSHEVFTT